MFFMATAQSVIKNFMSCLNNTSNRSTSALDEAVQSVSNFSSWSQLYNKMAEDCAAYNGDWKNFLKDMCGIDLDNADTGAITGSDAGGSSTKTAESIVPESGSWSYPGGTSFTSHGLTVNIPDQDTLSESEQFIVGALYSWWIDSALTLAEDSFGLSFRDAGATIKEIDLQFYNKSDGKMAYVEYSTGQKCSVLHLKINMNYYSDIDTSNVNGSATGLITYLDRTIAHEIVHAVMAANIDYFSSLPTSFKEGAAELVHGIDDKRYSTIQTVASNSSTLKSAITASGVNSYAAGYILLRYLAKQASEGRDPSTTAIPDNSTTDSSTTTTDSSTTTTTTTTDSSTTTTISGTTLTVQGDLDKNIWLGGTNILTGAANTDYANSNIITIDASEMTSSRILAGNDRNNKIISGTGGATLYGGAGNDTLTGGDKQDVFWYSSGGGNDIIQNFTSGKTSTCDNLCVSGELASFVRDGSVITFTMADGGTLKVNTTDNIDTAIKYSGELGSWQHYKIKIGNTTANNTFTYEQNVPYYFGGNARNTLKVSDSATIWLEEANYFNITEINAQSSTGENILAGDSNSNTIKGGAGTSALWGSTSSADDLLIGGSGENTFWYGQGEGNDTVQNSKATDKINFYNVELSDITNIETVDAGIKFSIGSGSLTVTDTLPKIQLADGSTWTWNNENSTWSVEYVQ